jgi:hypothetical protein
MTYGSEILFVDPSIASRIAAPGRSMWRIRTNNWRDKAKHNRVARRIVTSVGEALVSSLLRNLTDRLSRFSRLSRRIFLKSVPSYFGDCDVQVWVKYHRAGDPICAN